MAMLGFLQMNNEELGYDPSILSTPSGSQVIEIMRDELPERLILHELIRGVSCVVG